MANANNPSPEIQVEAPKPEEEKEEVTVEQVIEPVQTARQRADQLMGYLNHDKAVVEIFGDAFERQYIIYGKSPAAWRRVFKILVPENPNTSQCKAIAAKIGNLFQEANFYFAAAEAQLKALTSGETREYTTSFNKLVIEYKEAKRSLPASKTLETIASGRLLDIRGAIQNAIIIKDFWKRILEGINGVRKSLELVTWNNSTQARQEQYGGGGNIPDNQPNRGQFGTEVKDAKEDAWDNL